MQVQVEKWGERFVIPIPDSLVRDSNIRQGSTIDLLLINGKFIVAPPVEPEYTLDEFLAKVTDQNILI